MPEVGLGSATAQLLLCLPGVRLSVAHTGISALYRAKCMAGACWPAGQSVCLASAKRKKTQPNPRVVTR